MSQQEIRQAAKDRDVVKLQLLCAIDSIDCWKKGGYYYSAATELAVAKDYGSVEFLLSHGANLSYAVLGAAVARDHLYVKALLNRGASITYAAMGYAEVGELTKVYELLKFGANVSLVTRAIAKGLSTARANPHLLAKLQAFLGMLRNEVGECGMDVVFGAVLGGGEPAELRFYIKDWESWFNLPLFEALAFNGKLRYEAMSYLERGTVVRIVYQDKRYLLDTSRTLPLIKKWGAMGLDPAMDDFMVLPGQHVGPYSEALCSGWMQAGHFNKVKTYLSKVFPKIIDLPAYCKEQRWALELVERGHFSAYTKIFGRDQIGGDFAYTNVVSRAGDWRGLNKHITQVKHNHQGNMSLEGELTTGISAGLRFFRVEPRLSDFNHLMLFTLPFIEEQHLPQLFAAWSYSNNMRTLPISIAPSIRASITKNVRMMQQGHLSQAEALVLADAEQDGLLKILAMLALSLPCSLHKIPAEAHGQILSYLLPTELFVLSLKETTHLGYLAAKQYLSAQIACYAYGAQEKAGCTFTDQAIRFKEALQRTNTLDEMQALLILEKLHLKQWATEKNRNAWSTSFYLFSAQEDRYNEIIQQWLPPSPGVILTATATQCFKIPTPGVDDNHGRQSQHFLTQP